MTTKEFNKIEFEREMKKDISKKDIMTRGKRVSFETPIKNHALSELMYGDRESQNDYTKIWENLKRYN
ncbi:MAG: hypothetical protein Q8Q86_04045 [Candidatus Daviesbacteria bacterium]|nr:hypothetical protein [Candidatus Daviesbacteria bacterium]